MSQQCQASGRGPFRTLNIFDQTAESVALWIADAYRRIKNLLGDFDHAIEQRATTRQYDATRQLAVPT